MTTPDKFRPGDVFHYPYLWRWQRERGETEGRKDRPVCVVVAVKTAASDLTGIALLAISSQPPGVDEVALEIPEIECRRGGLADWKRAWITVSEFNYDIVERSYYLDPNPLRLGRFGKSFMMRIAASVAPLFRERSKRVDRTE